MADLLPDFADQWRQRAEQLRNSSGRPEETPGKRDRRDTDDQEYEENIVQSGEVFPVALGGKSKIASIELKYVGHVSDNGTQSSEDATDGKEGDICDVVAICSEDRRVDMESYVKLDPVTGFAVLEVSVTDKAMDVFGHPEIRFVIKIKYVDGTYLSKHYAVASESHREKRWTKYGSWTHWAAYEIRDRWLMPKYAKYWIDGCNPGHDGAAWSMIFGYFDRRGHYRNYGSLKNLYRSGYNGAWGYSSQVGCFTDY